MAASKTFNQIVDVFKYIADNHVFINSFSFVTELHEIAASTDTIYPALIVMPEGATTESNLLHYKYNIIVADLVHKDESNENEVLSDTLQTLLDIKAWLTNNQCNGFTLKKESTITPFTERWDDEVSGHVGNFELEIWNTDSLCALPGLVPCSGSNGLTNINTTSPCSSIDCLSAGTINVNNFYISGGTINNYVTGSTVINEYFTTIISGVSSGVTINIITGGTVNNYLSAFTTNIVTGITSGLTVDGTNVGGGAEVYSGKTGTTMMFFRTISGASAFVNIVQNPQTITIDTVDRYWEIGQAGNYSLMRKQPYSYGPGNLQHTVHTNYSTVTGGKRNIIAGNGYGRSLVGNGYYNSINDTNAGNASKYTTILNGRVNRINNVVYSSDASYQNILGGKINNGNSFLGFIGNGSNNQVASGSCNTIVNGYNNKAYGRHSTVVNATASISRGEFAGIITGSFCRAYSNFTSVVSGRANLIGNSFYSTQQRYSTINAGSTNSIFVSHSGSTAQNSHITGGYTNQIVASNYGTITNGKYNTIQDCNFSTILNGVTNNISGSYSLISNGNRNRNYGNHSSIIGSDDCEITLQIPDLEHVTIVNMQSYSATSANTLYTQAILSRALSGSTTRVVVADAEGLLSTTTAISVSGGSSSSVTYKASAATNSMFALTGGAYKYTVTFPSAFANSNYSIQITGQDERDWTYDAKVAASFTINSNSNFALTGTTDWFCIAYN